MVDTANVRVGIGTNLPTQTLDVNGNVNSNSRYVISAGGLLDITNAQGDTGLRWTSAGAGSDIFLRTASTDRLRVKNSGNVGIGTTNPLVELQIGDTGANFNLGGTPTSNGTGRIKFINSNSIQNWEIAFNDNVSHVLEFTPSTTNGGSTFTTPVMVLQDNGNVGIGTTNPLISLSVQNGSGGNTGYSGFMNDPNISISPALIFKSNSGISTEREIRFANDYSVRGDFAITQATAASVQDTGAGFPARFYIDASGNVGIGTTGPSRKLDVNDAIRFEPVSTPSSLSAGDCWFDSGTNKFTCYNGTASVGMDPNILVWSSTYTAWNGGAAAANTNDFYPIIYEQGNKLIAHAADNVVTNGIAASSGTIHQLRCWVASDQGNGTANTFALMKNGSAVGSCNLTSTNGTPVAKDSCGYEVNTTFVPGDLIDIRARSGNNSSDIFTPPIVCYLAYQISQ